MKHSPTRSFPQAGFSTRQQQRAHTTTSMTIPLSYADGFDQITGINEQDTAPLISFLEFINESSDANFVERLDEYLDVEALATYVAVQNLFMNFDDMAGPGNNSYLLVRPGHRALYDPRVGSQPCVHRVDRSRPRRPGRNGRSRRT